MSQRHCRAENETRTRDPDLGKVVLHQLSYFRSILGNCTPVLVNRDDKGTTILGTSKFFCQFFLNDRPSFLPDKCLSL